MNANRYCIAQVFSQFSKAVMNFRLGSKNIRWSFASCDFRHFRSNIRTVYRCFERSGVDHGTRGLFLLRRVIRGACFSRSPSNSLLYKRIKSSREYAWWFFSRSDLARSVIEWVYINILDFVIRHSVQNAVFVIEGKVAGNNVMIGDHITYTNIWYS